MAPKRVRRRAAETPSERTPWSAEALSRLLDDAGAKRSHTGPLLRSLAAKFAERAGEWLWPPEGDAGSSRDVGWQDLSVTEDMLTSMRLPKRAAANLLAISSPLGLRPVGRFDSADGSTTKLALELRDGHKVETVVMRHEGRTTVCVSSQVGCQMGCAFCATGTLPITGDLDAGEIVEQVLLAHALEVAAGRPPVRNAVFMGMGEPLNNYSAVLQALQVLVDNTYLGKYSLPQSRVTVSTVGVAARMHQLAEDMPGVNLALSLHAPNQELREHIVPAAKQNRMPELLAALDGHATQCRRSAGNVATMIEYVLLAGVNDSDERALELGRLMAERPKGVLVNLIPYNAGATSSPVSFTAPSHQAVERFQEIVAAAGVPVRVRREMGRDIAGACGQLALASSGGAAAAAAAAKAAGGDGPAAAPQEIEDFIAWRRKQPRSSKASVQADCIAVLQGGGVATAGCSAGESSPQAGGQFEAQALALMTVGAATVGLSLAAWLLRRRGGIAPALQAYG